MIVAHPFVAILAALSLPLYYLSQRLRRRSHDAMAFVYSNLDCFTQRVRGPWWPIAAARTIEACALGLLIAGGAGIGLPAIVTKPFAAIVYCVDTSGSMANTDVNPTRAAAARRALESAIASSPAATRIGLVSFAGSAQVQSPPTTDRAALRQAIAAIPPPNGQTAIGDALQSAYALLPRQGNRAIVLLTDGVNNTGSSPAAAELALRAAHVRLYYVLITPAFSARTIPSHIGLQAKTRAFYDLSPFLASFGCALLCALSFMRVAAGRF